MSFLDDLLDREYSEPYVPVPVMPFQQEHYEEFTPFAAGSEAREMVEVIFSDRGLPPLQDAESGLPGGHEGAEGGLFYGHPTSPRAPGGTGDADSPIDVDVLASKGGPAMEPGSHYGTCASGRMHSSGEHTDGRPTNNGSADNDASSDILCSVCNNCILCPVCGNCNICNAGSGNGFYRLCIICIVGSVCNHCLLCNKCVASNAPNPELPGPPPNNTIVEASRSSSPVYDDDTEEETCENWPTPSEAKRLFQRRKARSRYRGKILRLAVGNIDSQGVSTWYPINGLSSKIRYTSPKALLKSKYHSAIRALNRKFD